VAEAVREKRDKQRARKNFIAQQKLVISNWQAVVMQKKADLHERIEEK